MVGGALLLALNAFAEFAPQGTASSIISDSQSQITVAFSPKQGATDAIVTFIGEAKESIQVAAYSFTSPTIAKALLDAQQRGVDVSVVLDKSNETAQYTAATFLENSRVPLRINHRYKIMHSKYMIIDGTSVETGSFNYTKSAEEGNAENVIIVRNNRDLAQAYHSNWQRLWNEGKPYASKRKTD